MEPFWLIAICALAASVGSLVALRPGERERSTLFFLVITAGLAGFPVFALGHSLGWWGRAPSGGWASAPRVEKPPGEQRGSLVASDCPKGSSLLERVGPPGRVQMCAQNGERHGRHRAWRHDGVLTLDCNWRVGRLDGACERWYLRQGRDLVVNLHRGDWVKGLRNGLHVDRFRTGRLHYEAFFLRGQPRGRVVVRGPAGQTIARLQFDADGAAGRWLRWHRETGNVLSDGYFKGGKPDGVWKLTDGQTGRLWLQAQFQAGVLRGPYTEWNPWGAVVLQSTHLDGRLHGPYTLRHDNGRLWVEGEMAAGHQVGLWKVWDRSGQQLRVCHQGAEPEGEAHWCSGRGPWVGRQAPLDLLLEQQVDWYRVSTGQEPEQPLEAYDFHYAFPDWSPL